MPRFRSTRLSLCLALALLGAFGGHELAMAQDAGVSAVADKSAAGELAFWNQIKDSQNPADFKTYLQNFPDGMFVDPALRKFEQAGGQKSELPPLVTAKDAVEDMTAKPAQAEVPAVKAKAKKVAKVKTKKTVKVPQSKKKNKKIVRGKTKAKATKVVRAKSRKVRSGVGLAQPASLRCKSGRIINGRCAAVTVKQRKPAGGGSDTPDSGGWGGGGGGSGGGWGG